MSFQLSSGTLDSLAGVFSPSKKRRPGSGGGAAKGSSTDGTAMRAAVAAMFPKSTGGRSAYRAPARTKQAFGGGTQTAVSRRAVATMERTSRRVPEVMVRVTGRQHGGGHVLANFAYISRLGHGPEKETGLYTSEGEVIHDGREMQKLAQEWHEYDAGDDTRRKGATSLSMILSMPTGTDPERVKVAALAFAGDEFANRSWVASLHVDRDHPHVHITVARRDHDGRRFHPDRDDLFRYRQRFATKLRELGIEANATPARARGIDPKHEHIAARKVRLKGEVPRLDVSRAARLERYRAAGRSDPVDTVLAQQRATVRAAYERSIAELTASPSLVNKTVAQSLQRFVDALPGLEANSIRAVGSRATAIGERERSGKSAGARASDQIAAATAKLKSATERSKAAAAARELGLTPPSFGDGSPEAGISGRRGTRRDEVFRAGPAEPPDKAAAVLRQVQDRDRAHRDRERDRDRSPDRGGPRK